uniref:C-X-C motif chemokine n=1 Tax=Gopherus evgoodei TaxID=1825980 RepID=A0A8C4W110_9SAUR
APRASPPAAVCPGPPLCRVSSRRQELSLSPPPRAGAPMAGELRCQCLQTEAAVIHPKRIAHVELIPEGPHCGVPEVIATTKHGKKVCLDPTAPWVKLIVTKIMNSRSRNASRWGLSGCHF